ncbi:MAG: regulatory protein GemA [Boseongicola sp. SB0673_bin_14]|nr:regulatory protein GemA [Boseongicola sp. SB0673_bin_14]
MPRTDRADPAREARNRLIRAIHATARVSGLDDETRKNLQLQLTGQASCADMTVPQLQSVVAALQAVQKKPVLPDGPYTGKMRALWKSGWNLGVVRNPGDKALAAFVRRTTNLDSARWATDPVHASGVIEGLKSLLSREAGVDWSPYAVGRRLVHDPKRRVLEAQLRILQGRGLFSDFSIDTGIPWGTPDRALLKQIGTWGESIRATRKNPD